MKLKTLLGAMFVNVPILIRFYDKNDPSSSIFPIKECSWKECLDEFGDLKVITIKPCQDKYDIELCKEEKKKWKLN